MKINCSTCGVELRRKPTKATGNRYCSRSCYGKAKRVDINKRFWAKVEKTEACWVWTGAKDRAGYGKFGIDGQTKSAHRVAWLLACGEEVPSSMHLCHHCDNPSCVRPDHLFVGTAADNTHDMIRKGRRVLSPRKGEANGRAILTKGKADELRRRAAEGASTKALAAAYGVSLSTVRGVMRGEWWT